ncbi:DNA-3-methyladenine glycosylase I [Rhodococcus sp. X156]|uniref:DNA-3-methyladenine glycosylase I n=1 Tax=Rhodococcus sp. X156 TaxID=2499145 RepID=UPI0024081653|nr:DNA-3-methyladenine glycosylase I [Rhodococcus sp. X156]
MRRCSWGQAPEIYRRYHDEEWGRVVHGRDALYERLCLEAFQAGLSWITVLRKREDFRRAFAGFDPERVAGFGDADVQRLLADASIVRNRAKIEATVSNARAVLDVDDLDALLWSFAPAPTGADQSWDPTTWTPRATSPESVAMAKELKRRGFRFVGPTTAHSLMQAVGMVNDHHPGCWLADPRWQPRDA